MIAEEIIHLFTVNVLESHGNAGAAGVIIEFPALPFRNAGGEGRGGSLRCSSCVSRGEGIGMRRGPGRGFCTPLWGRGFSTPLWGRGFCTPLGGRGRFHCWSRGDIDREGEVILPRVGSCSIIQILGR